MKEKDLVKISDRQLGTIWTILWRGLDELLKYRISISGTDSRVPENVNSAVERLKRILDETVAQPTYERASEISTMLGFLSLAVLQQPVSLTGTFKNGKPVTIVNGLTPTAQDLGKIEELIQSCYEPFQSYVELPLFPSQGMAPIPPDQISAVYFQGDYLARPKGPAPFMIVPNYFHPDPFQEDESANWIGVAHEVGHHIYRQIPYLREELEVTLAKVLYNYKQYVITTITPNQTCTINKPEAQQRLWFHYLEETFADLIGVMSLGAAFVYSQTVILLGRVVSALDGAGKIKADDLIKLQVGDDLTHPIPYLRGRMGVYMYARLLGFPTTNPDLNDLQTIWDTNIPEVFRDLVKPPMYDPHTPQSPGLIDNWNKDGTLDRIDTYWVMCKVIDTLLDTPLRSLGNKKLVDVVPFSSDESERSQLQNESIQLSQAKLRNQIAAKRLAANKQLISA